MNKHSLIAFLLIDNGHPDILYFFKNLFLFEIEFKKKSLNLENISKNFLGIIIRFAEVSLINII